MPLRRPASIRSWKKSTSRPVRYAGTTRTATHFQGTFAAGQKVRVEMHGITHSYDQTFANSNKIEWDARSPSISG